MNIRFYHAKILLTKAGHTFEVAEGELWVRGDHICYIGDGTDTSAVCKEDDIIIWDREIDAKGNLLMPGFKNAHTHTPMTFLRSFADDLVSPQILICTLCRTIISMPMWIRGFGLFLQVD